jgi:integrase/recombinase XerD
MSMMHQGTTPKRLRQVATGLLLTIRVMDLSSLRPVETSEIDSAKRLWLSALATSGREPTGKASMREFRRDAMNWLRFHHSLAPRISAPQAYDEILSPYLTYVNLTVSPVTAKRYFRWARLFLTMTRDLPPSLAQLSTVEIDRFIDGKRSAGYKPRSLATVCGALRYFLRFTESHGWTPARLSMTIESPRIQRYDRKAGNLRWRDVRRLLNSCGHGRADIRARAIISLCAIYALRASEVVNLNLNDFNWIDEAFTVRRAKSGMVQRFPIQCEMGEAILEYLRECRPSCSNSFLFVTLSPPYRRVCAASVSDIIRDRLRRLKVEAPSMGAHSVRRACATELMRKGVPLPNIADFLGHKDLSSVSLYAKCSPRSLENLTCLSLKDLL